MLNNGAQPLVEIKSDKDVTIAIEEIKEGKLNTGIPEKVRLLNRKRIKQSNSLKMRNRMKPLMKIITNWNIYRMKLNRKKPKRITSLKVLIF